MRLCSAGHHSHNPAIILLACRSSCILQALTQWQVFTHRNWHHNSQPCTSCSTSSYRQEVEQWREVLPTGRAANGTFFSAKCKDLNRVSSICLPRTNSRSNYTKCPARPALRSAVAEMSQEVGQVAPRRRSPTTPLLPT